MSDEQQQSNNPTRITRTRAKTLASQNKFLKAYGECGVIKYACIAAGIDRSTYYDWRDNDQEFRERLPDKKSEAIDTLEYAAYVQSVLGTEEPVVSAGKVMYNKDGTPCMVRRYSPQLLITLLKANNPEKYKEKQQIEHSGSLTIKTEWGGGALDEEEASSGSALIQ